VLSPYREIPYKRAQDEQQYAQVVKSNSESYSQELITRKLNQASFQREIGQVYDQQIQLKRQIANKDRRIDMSHGEIQRQSVERQN